MSREAKAVRRSMENFTDILRGVREDLTRAKAAAEDAFVKSLAGERHGGYNHIADADPADRASQKKGIDLGHRIQKIDAAIERINRGTFGKCLKLDECEGDGEIEHTLIVKDPPRIYCGSCQQVEDEKTARNKQLMSCRGSIGGKH